MSLRTRLVDWGTSRRDALLDSASAVLAALALIGGSNPVWAQAAVIAAVIWLLPVRAEATPVRVLLRRFPAQFVIALSSGFVGRHFFALENSVRLPVLWLGLIVGLRLALQVWEWRSRWMPRRERLDLVRRKLAQLNLPPAYANGLLLTGGLGIFAALDPDLEASPLLILITGLAWVGIDRLAGAHWRAVPAPCRPEVGRHPLVGLPFGRGRCCMLFILALAGWSVAVVTTSTLLGLPLDRHVAAFATIGCVILAGLAVSEASSGTEGHETVRRLWVLGLALVSVAPLTVPLHQWGGDADWYALTIADAVTQVRSGVFPVFVGQSADQFNGGISPIRIAPLLQHLAMIADGLTWRALPLPALVNSVLIGLGMLTALLVYHGLAGVLAERRGAAAALAVMVFFSPGVLAVLHQANLYMTWAALPWLSLILLGNVRSFREERGSSLALVAVGLGLVWWAHAPVALWMTGLTVFLQLVRLVFVYPRIRDVGQTVGASAVVLLLALYPIVSVVFSAPETSGDTISSAHVDPAAISALLAQNYPAALLPVSPYGDVHSDFQYGWSWWSMVPFILVAAWRFRRPELVALTLVGLVLLVLVLPFPGINEALWRLVPAGIRNPSGNWPETRLLAILSALTAFATALALREKLGPRMSRIITLILASAAAWSCWEASKFVRGSWRDHRAVTAWGYRFLPENRLLTRYSYGFFSPLPPYFSHGVVDPHLEQRLLRDDDHGVLLSNYSAIGDHGRELARGTLHGQRRGVEWGLEPTLLIEPGKRYLLELRFLQPAATGTLVMRGGGISRIHGLPSHGAPQSFGAGPHALPYVALWTTNSQPVELELKFEPAEESMSGDFREFAAYRWLEYLESELPVVVTNWIPYEADVTAPEPAWLETPRLYQEGYRAWVNERPAETQRSPAGLVMTRVPAGASSVRIEYRAPLKLRLSYLVSGSTLLVILGAGLLRRFTVQRVDPP